MVLICLLFVLLSVSVYATDTSAKAAIVINGITGEVIYEHNSGERLPMASTTKIMTALILAEQQDLSKEICCTKEMVTVEGSSMGLLVGDRVTYHDLLYGMLLASGNDAANTTAISIAGSTEKFAEIMNQKAKELNLENTHFVTPSGLDADEHYTTAYDLAMLSAYALKNEKFKKACSSYTARLCYGNPPYHRTLTNHNKLLKSYEGLVGVKTGFTKKSGRCLVTAAERDGAQIVVVTLSDRNDWQDHRNLLDFGFASVEKTTYDFDGVDYLNVLCGEKEKTKLVCDSFEIYIKPENASKISYKINIPEYCFAPVSVGECVGYVDLFFEDKLIKKIEVTSAEDVMVLEKPKETFFDKILKNFVKIIINV